MVLSDLVDIYTNFSAKLTAHFTAGELNLYFPASPTLGIKDVILCSWFRASQIYIIKLQRDAKISSLYFILLQDHSTYFGCLSHPSSGVHETVVTVTGTSHISR